jgi:hypothetical protein
MTQLGDILHNSEAVWSVRSDGRIEYLAVWHGGHTVNSYLVEPSDSGFTVDPVSTASAGDYETDETTRDEAESAAMDLLTRPEEEP